jgi:hypothetical protein
MTKRELKDFKRQEKLAAKLRARQIREKYKTMQAITGKAKLSSSFGKNQKKILNAIDRYGYVVEVNKACPLDQNEFEMAS